MILSEMTSLPGKSRDFEKYVIFEKNRDFKKIRDFEKSVILKKKFVILEKSYEGIKGG